MRRPRGSRAVRAGLVALVLGATSLSGCTDDGDEPRPHLTGTASVGDRSVLDPWYEAARGSDGAAANLVVLGDSVSEGYGLEGRLERRWGDRVQSRLRQRAGAPACPRTPGGWHGTTSLVPADYRAPSLPDPQVQGPARPAGDVGPGGRALILEPGAEITWRVDAHSFDVGYRTTAGGGPLQVSVDGRVPLNGVAVSTDSAAGAGGSGQGERRVWSSPDLAPGTHTVTVRNAMPAGSDLTATVTDLTPFRGDRGRCVHVLDASRSGVSVRTITQSPGYVADAVSLDPDLLLVPLGFNDRRAEIAPGDFGRSLDELLGQVRDEGYDGPVLLVGWFNPGIGSVGPSWPDYLAQMRARTRHAGVSYVDLSVVLPRADPATGAYIDALHPSDVGHQLIADALIEVLVPRSVGTSGVPPG
ncbi:GDSL-type esterase/lipase family protein [Janibacter terrae]|uniref:GDSL-type esterase/lipase family protein n=1 Tax=Janibacter terrae TaxID=103817 RepID=UPI0038256792